LKLLAKVPLLLNLEPIKSIATVTGRKVDGHGNLVVTYEFPSPYQHATTTLRERTFEDPASLNFPFPGKGITTNLDANVGDKLVIDVYLTTNVRTWTDRSGIVTDQIVNFGAVRI
jgi:hypothetical protein